MRMIWQIIKRVLFVIYSGAILGLALPVAVAIHVYNFAVHLEEKWTLWVAVQIEKTSSTDGVDSATGKGQDTPASPKATGDA